MKLLMMEYEISHLSILNDYDDSLILEGTVYDILDDIISFIDKIIQNMIAFAKKLKNDVDSMIQKKQVRFKLNKLKKELEEQQSDGVKKVSMIDVESFVSYYKSYSSVIMRKAKILARGNFKTKDKLERHIDDLQTDIDDMNEELERCIKHRKTVSIKKAIEYVEDNLSGRNPIEAEFVNVQHQLKELEIDVKKYLNIAMNTSSDNLRRNYVSKPDAFANTVISSLKSSIGKIGSFFGKWFSKFVMAVVFFFA